MRLTSKPGSDPRRDRHPHETPPILAFEIEVLPDQMSGLGLLGDLYHLVTLALLRRHELVDRFGVVWGDGV